MQNNTVIAVRDALVSEHARSATYNNATFVSGLERLLISATTIYLSLQRITTRRNYMLYVILLGNVTCVAAFRLVRLARIIPRFLSARKKHRSSCELATTSQNISLGALVSGRNCRKLRANALRSKRRFFLLGEPFFSRSREPR